MNKSHAVGWAKDSPTPAQLKELFAQIESGRLKKKDAQLLLKGYVGKILEKVGGEKGLRRLIRGRIELTQKPLNMEAIEVLLKSCPLSELTEEANFKWINPNISNEAFPVISRIDRTEYVCLFSYEDKIRSEEIIQDMADEGFRPANIFELVALASAKPFLVGKNAIVAFGSTFEDLSPAWIGKRFCLSLLTKDSYWTSEEFLFAAVKL